MRAIASAVWAVILCVSNARADVYPSRSWQKTDPATLGWSTIALTQAKDYFRRLPPASVFVVDRGQVVVSWGDPARKIKVSSIRKSILSVLYGIYDLRHSLDLDSTLSQLAVNDEPPLSETERTATVRMLLEARSGVYHGYVAGTPGMRADWPKRGSHPPGSYWYYNNWDFNALGTIFEQQFGTHIGDAFEISLAQPLQLEDFQSSDMYYLRARPNADPAFDSSVHPAYHFRLSARDLGRIGYLFLQRGRWSGRQIVSEAWVADSTRTHSQASVGEGYGYLWWTDGFNLTEPTFSAQGALAKYLVVVPSRRLVIVYLNHTEFPDDAASLSAADVQALPTISHQQMSHLLQLFLKAQRP